MATTRVITRTDERFDVVNVVGQRLRERRRELGLTLAEVGAAAEISVGHCSAIEKGGTLPSLPVLARLAHALDLTLAEVLREFPGPRVAHGRLGNGPGPARLVPTSSRLAITSVRQRARETAPPPFPLTGDDVFVFVHRGSVGVEVNGDRHELAAGDSIHCHAPRAITCTAGGDGAATLWVSRAPRARET
jgi:transcriptional regulator with XRE-family HTH domain